MNHMLSGINGVLYGITILIWGSSWIMIKFQVEVVSASISIFYRFFLAAIILQCLCLIKRQKSVYALREYIFIAIQGFCLFAVNYWLFYLSAEYLSSGLMALIFSTIVVMNMINGRIWFGTTINLKMVFGAMMGISGLTLVFWPEIQWEDSNYNMFKGLIFAFVATYFSSLGNIVSVRNQKKGIPVFYSNAYAMTFGCLTMLMITMITNEPWNFSWNPQFLLSLVFLSVFASVVGFWCYLTLLGRVGADRGAYATLIFPIVALSISTVFEGYQWSLIAISGVVLILLGNFIILKPSS